jgi:hypothetical protein
VHRTFIGDIFTVFAVLFLFFMGSASAEEPSHIKSDWAMDALADAEILPKGIPGSAGASVSTVEASKKVANPISSLLGLHPDLVDLDDFYKLSLRLLLDLFFASIIIFLVYVRRHGKTEYVFTYFMFNAITFMICFLLRKVPIELGFALSLFAVFGILRYRTEPIRIHDLTYLFVVIGIAILNAVANKKVSLAELLLVNSFVTGLTALIELHPFFARHAQQQVLYDDMERIRSGDMPALIEDLRMRTGLDIKRADIGQIDLLRETVRITVFYPGRRQ